MKSSRRPLGRLQNRRVPLLGTVGHPVLELIGNLVQYVAGHTFSLPIRIEETDHALGLLKRLDQSVQKQPVETTIGEANAILVMLEKGVHGNLQCGEIPGAYTSERLRFYASAQSGCTNLPRSAGVAEGAPVRARSLFVYRRIPEAGDLCARVSNETRAGV